MTGRGCPTAAPNGRRGRSAARARRWRREAVSRGGAGAARQLRCGVRAAGEDLRPWQPALRRRGERDPPPGQVAAPAGAGRRERRCFKGRWPNFVIK